MLGLNNQTIRTPCHEVNVAAVLVVGRLLHFLWSLGFWPGARNVLRKMLLPCWGTFCGYMVCNKTHESPWAPPLLAILLPLRYCDQIGSIFIRRLQRSLLFVMQNTNDVSLVARSTMASENSLFEYEIGRHNRCGSLYRLRG
jgi:hypothetical protein